MSRLIELNIHFFLLFLLFAMPAEAGEKTLPTDESAKKQLYATYKAVSPLGHLVGRCDILPMRKRQIFVFYYRRILSDFLIKNNGEKYRIKWNKEFLLRYGINSSNMGDFNCKELSLYRAREMYNIMIKYGEKVWGKFSRIVLAKFEIGRLGYFLYARKVAEKCGFWSHVSFKRIGLSLKAYEKIVKRRYSNDEIMKHSNFHNVYGMDLDKISCNDNGRFVLWTYLYYLRQRNFDDNYRNATFFLDGFPERLEWSP